MHGWAVMDDLDQLIRAFRALGRSDGTARKLDLLMDIGRAAGARVVRFLLITAGDGNELPDVRLDVMQRLREASLTPGAPFGS